MVLARSGLLVGGWLASGSDSSFYRYVQIIYPLVLPLVETETGRNCVRSTTWIDSMKTMVPISSLVSSLLL